MTIFTQFPIVDEEKFIETCSLQKTYRGLYRLEKISL